MAIIYAKLIAKLKEAGYTSYKIKTEGLIGTATYYHIINGDGGLDYRSLDKLCKRFNCQPGDLMEYVPDPIEEQH